MPHQGSDISRQITQFGKGLSSFSRRLEDDIAELKRAVSSKLHTGREFLAGWACSWIGQTLLGVSDQAPKLNADAQMQHCLHDMAHRATASGQEISALECMTIDAISLEVFGFDTTFAEHIAIFTGPTRCCMPFLQEICGHCLQLFQENQARISHLESYLQQYGYQPQAGFSIPLNPFEPVKSAGMCDAETPLQVCVSAWQRPCATAVVCVCRWRGGFLNSAL